MASISISIRKIKILQRVSRLVIISGILAILGLGFGFYRLYAGLGSTTNLNTAFPWGLWISFDLTMVAFSGAAFTLAALVYVFHQHDLHSALRPAVLFGLLGYSSVLVTLFFDLGRWDRFWHFIIYPNLTSALFEVSWCILIYTMILLYEFSPVLMEKLKKRRLKTFLGRITIPMIIAGITLSSMHQSSLGSLFVILPSRLHPLWYSMLQPVFFLTSSLSAGIAAILIGSSVSRWIHGQTLSLRVIEKLGSFLPWFLGVYLVLKLGELVFAGEVNLLFSSGIFSLLYLLELIAGVVIPILFFLRKTRRQNRSITLLGAVLIAMGIILNRFNVSWFALRQLDGTGYFPSGIEIVLVIGICAGVILIFTLISNIFPVFEETLKEEEAASEESGGSFTSLSPGD